MAHTLLGAQLLSFILQEEFEDMAGGQIGGQVIEGAVTLALGTAAIGFAAGGEALNVRSAEQILRDSQLAQESRLAVS